MTLSSARRRFGTGLSAGIVVALMVAGCTGSAVVQPGPRAAERRAAALELGPVTMDLPAPAATCVNAPAGWSAREAARQGASGAPRGRVHAWMGPVVGYLDGHAAVCGQTMTAHLSSEAGDVHVRLRALRIGFYHGAGSRQVWQSPVVLVRHQAQALPTGPDRVIRERWPAAAEFTVAASWPPGFYLIEVAPVNADLAPSFIPLVVRTSGARSPYLVVASDLTWMAYNSYGGRSLYGGPGSDHAQWFRTRSYVSSSDRPLVAEGLRQMFAMDVPLIRFLSRSGLSADVTTDSSLDAEPTQLHGQVTVIIGGHSEYWTKRMYDAAVRARDAGTNFAFLGANEVYWQGRIERDEQGRMTGLTVYKDAHLDPFSKASPATTTVQWRDPPLNRDPASLVGQGMSVVGVQATYVVASTPQWLFAGTGVKPGDELVLGVGDEGDAQESPGRFSPVNLQVILHAVGVGKVEHRPSLITAGYYDAPSGAGVFSAGTTYWPCALDASCPHQRTPNATRTVLQQITLNLLKAFAARQAGRLHPSTGSSYQPASTLATTMPVGGPL